MSGRPGFDARPQKRPQRTCVGCRSRADKSELLRVVVEDGALVPDPRGRLPGRGASVHLDPGCLDLAERRRAFPRALRHPGPLDVSAVRSWIETAVEDGRTSRTAGRTARMTGTTASTPSSTSNGSGSRPR